MATGPAIEAPGLKELARDLKKIDPRIGKEMSRAHKEVSTDVANAAQQNVSGITDAGGRGAAGIRARATPSKASIALLGSNDFTFAAVFGTELHWIWGRPYPASLMSRRAWQPWIGANWTPEEGLYGVSPAIVSKMDDVLKTYSERMMAALSQAFPEGSNG